MEKVTVDRAAAIETVLESNPNKKTRKPVRYGGGMRTYVKNESKEKRAKRIKAETNVRLSIDQEHKKYERCPNCKRRIKSAAHECTRGKRS